MNGDTVLTLILQAGPVVKFVLLLLLFFSIVSWAIIIYKHRFLSRVEKESRAFQREFMSMRAWSAVYQSANKYPMSPLAGLFRAIYPLEDASREEIVSTLRRVKLTETERLEKYLSFLATTGSTSPFIGLFGTVWGIMNSFMGIGRVGAASLAVVAPGIAEALIATAAGLAAAIPAVIAYNYYLSRARRSIMQMDEFSQELIEFWVKRHGEAKAGTI